MLKTNRRIVAVGIILCLFPVLMVGALCQAHTWRPSAAAVTALVIAEISAAVNGLLFIRNARDTRRRKAELLDPARVIEGESVGKEIEG